MQVICGISTHHTTKKEEIRQSLKNLADMAGPEKLLLILGDFNAHRGSTHSCYEQILGQYVLGSENAASTALFDMHIGNQWVIANTWFKK